MRTTKILSLLFSLGQLLLVLKLIEYVRGDPLRNASHPLEIFENNEHDKTSDSSNDQRDSRHFFIAPRMKERKYRPWLTTTTEAPTTNYPYESSENATGEQHNGTLINLNQNRMDKYNNNLTSAGVDNSTEDNGSSRKCPGCEGGTCGGNVIPYGFPFKEVLIAKIVGVIWFFIFLFVWYFVTEPPKKAVGYAPSPSSGGYDSMVGGGSTGSGGFLGSLSNLFGGQQRSLETFNELSSRIIETLDKLSTVYGES